MLNSGFDVTIFATKKSKFWSNFELLNERQDIKSRLVYSVFQHKDNSLLLLLLAIFQVSKSILNYPLDTVRLIKNVRKHCVFTNLKFLPQFLHHLMFVGRKIDILHVEFDFQSYGIVEIKHLLKCKVVVSGRGSVARTSVLAKFPDFYAYLFKHVDHYHFISEYLLNEAKHAGLPSSLGTSLIAPAIDLSLFKPQERKRQNNVIKIVSMGRLSWAKGYEFMMDAVARVHHQYPDITYTILGGGEYKEAISFAAWQHGLAEKEIVNFKGLIAREDVVNYLQEADIMLHLALEEGFCNAVIEGQAMELPVVCSDAGGLPENVLNNSSGFVVPRRNSQAAAEAILKLIKDKSLRDQMGINGRERVKRLFDLNNQQQKFRSMYEAIES